MNVKETYSLADFGVKLHKFTLSNGLPVIFIEKPFAPIYAEIGIIAGSIFNPSDNGLAHLAEHMLVSASKNFPRKDLIAQIINPKGGRTNARTGLKLMTVECEVAISEHLPEMKLFFTEALCDMYINPELFEKEKKVITAETLQSLSKPSTVASTKLRAIIFGNSPWGHSNLGELELMKEITKEDVTLFYESHCHVENMELTICGGCTVDDVKTTFESIPIRSDHKRTVLPPEIEGNIASRMFIEHDVPQSELNIFFAGPQSNTRESAVLKFVMRFAHSGLDSLFFNKIRNERGLAYSVNTSTITIGRSQYFGTTMLFSPERVDESIETVFECYEELLGAGMSQDQIQSKINKDYFIERRSLQTSESWVDIFSGEILEDEPLIIGDYPEIFNFWKTITPDEVSTVLKKYVRLDDFNISLIGRHSNSKFF